MVKCNHQNATTLSDGHNVWCGSCGAMRECVGDWQLPTAPQPAPSAEACEAVGRTLAARGFAANYDKDSDIRLGAAAIAAVDAVRSKGAST